MKRTYILLSVIVALMAVIGAATAGTVKSSGLKGNWSGDTTWIGHILPGPSDTAVIADADSVTYDMDSSAHYSIAKLVVGEGHSGSLRTDSAKVTSLTVTGDIVVNDSAAFRVRSRAAAFLPDLLHNLYLYGNLTSNGNVDFRTGATSSFPQTLSVINVTFLGSQNSVVKLTGGFSTSTNEFNAVTINKSGTANVILGSDMYIAGGSTAYPNLNSLLIFKHGKIITGNYALIHLSTLSTTLQGYNDSSYVLGALGRGMAQGTPASKLFPVGDESGYRPMTVTSETGGLQTGHHVIVRVIHSNANTGTSTLNGISKVSQVRYYKVTYRTVIGSGSGTPVDTMDLASFSPTYGLDDGIRAGNQNLRVAYSIDNRATWTKMVMAKTHTTNLDSLPRRITPDTVHPYIHLDTLSTVAYAALADSSGPNPLDGTVSGFSLSKTSLAFGTVLIDSTKWDSVVVTNTGTGSLTIRNHTEVDSLRYETSPPTPIVIPVGGTQTFRISFRPDTLGTFPSMILFYHDAPHNPDTLVVTGSAPSVVTVNLNSGWNIVSLPVVPANDSAKVIYPTAISRLYSYNGSYQISPTLTPGNGYWVKFATAPQVTVTGLPIALDTVDVLDGWNIIGALTAKMATSSIVPIGTSIISKVFGYLSGYQKFDTLVPGSGYWIKVTPAGRLAFSTPRAVPKGASQTDPLASMNRLLVRDAAGNNQTLYFGDQSSMGTSSADMYSLPPVPPEGFDARFASQRMVETGSTARQTTHAIQITAAVYPVTISWELVGNSTGAALSINGRRSPLVTNGWMVVRTAEQSMALVLNGASRKPSEYALMQNYPNPFNPTTNISFDLPQTSVVTLRVFNVLGEEVSTIYDHATLAAGNQTVQFDAQNLPSGVYFYRLSAENGVDGKSFANVKKMLILR